ncbi:hypothetical protein L211DRAFT_444575 [Terfezia boudieri ATCC MYA-4762]|uniref:Uncharacterized protein n=1 Tax=Terfezia boudieri ATCC MYA-4762 TaxID=1051890 RepID=A0A3N4LEQ6_9PEZI|nr:hypothetical protein L211DRAFT_444575 [Terfezia boudieri ATCC MYA-4762]
MDYTGAALVVVADPTKDIAYFAAVFLPPTLTDLFPPPSPSTHQAIVPSPPQVPPQDPLSGPCRRAPPPPASPHMALLQPQTSFPTSHPSNSYKSSTTSPSRTSPPSASPPAPSPP